MASRRDHKLLEPGSQAPRFRLEGLEGGETSLDDWTRRGPVLLAFFKVACPVCQLTFPFLERIHRAGKLAILAISQDAAPDTRQFHEHFGISIPTLLDREENGFPVSNAFGISSVPSLFLLEGPQGTVTRVIEGWQKREIEALGTLAGIEAIRSDDHVPEWKPG